MNNSCPCPKNGCVKTARYLQQRLDDWDGRVCPHCGNALTNRNSDKCPCEIKFCPCMNRDARHLHTKGSCPCIAANCDCLDPEWKANRY